MLSEQRAARLADQAGRRRPDGTRGLVARRAWRRLVAAGDGGDRNAAEAVWRTWLPELDEERWQVLSRWRDQEALAAAVLAAAIGPGQPAATRAAIGAFCAGHGLAPDDEVQRVLFVALTGQPEQRRALDPDGRLLAAAYRGAWGATRTQLRAAIASAGELDLLHVVAGSDDPASMARLDTTERAYLAEQLAGRADWARLWRLTCAAPLPEAVTAARRFPDGQPGEEGARWLTRRLAAADPGAIKAAIDRLKMAAATPLASERTVVSGSFAPDGSRLAICALPAPRAHPGPAIIHLFPQPGSLPASWIGVGEVRHGAILDFGPDVLVLEDRTGGYRLTGFYARRAVLLSGGSDRYRLAEPPYPFRPLIRFGEGFVTSADGTALLLGTPPAETVTRVTPGDLGLPWADCWPLASHPASGRLAVRGGGELAVLDASLAVIARGPDPGETATEEAAFADAGRLVTSSIERLTSWRLDGRTLRCEAVADGWFSHLTARSGHGQVAALGPRSPAGEPRFRLTLFDAGDLSVIDDSPGPGGRQVTCVWGSADGSQLAAGYDDGLVLIHDYVFRMAAEVAGRSIAAMRPADRPAVADARGHDPRPELRELLDLLRACLDYRFGTEVALGRTKAAGPDDVAIRYTGEE